jgi:hypothetical protein
MIAPDLKLSFRTIRTYEKYGYFEKRGKFWAIRESHIVIKPGSNGECLVQFCGNPSILWQLYVKLFKKCKERGFNKLPVIKVVEHHIEKWYVFPYLEMSWPSWLEPDIKKHFESKGVKGVSELWTL